MSSSDTRASLDASEHMSPLDAERLLDSILEYVPIGMMVFDAAGTLIRLNAAQRKLSGLPNYVDPVGRLNVLTDPISEELRPAYRAAYAGSACSLVGQKLEHSTMMSELGIARAERYCDLFVFPLKNASGDVVNIVAFVVDATARTLAAQEREQIAARLAERHRVESLSTLAGGIAHDFNNMLMTISAEARASRSAESLEEARSALERIGDAAQKMTDLTGKLLSYVGVRPGKTERFHLDAVARETLEGLLQSLPPEAKVSSGFAASDATAEMDPNEIREIVATLVTNALEALRGGGRISVATRLQSSSRGSAWQLEVTDDGCGMDETVRARLFDPFFGTKTPGRGLGLSAVSGIVRRLGGNIEVDSAPGRGAHFTLSFPCELLPREEAPLRSRPRDQSVLPGLSILVVDDNAMLRDSLARLLAVSGAEALKAGSCAEALRLCATRRVDAALIDVIMPEVDGWETLRRLRKAGVRAPILMMSGHTFDAGGDHEGESDGFLSKPFNLRELEQLLSAALA